LCKCGEHWESRQQKPESEVKEKQQQAAGRRQQAAFNNGNNALETNLI